MKFTALATLFFAAIVTTVAAKAEAETASDTLDVVTGRDANAEAAADLWAPTIDVEAEDEPMTLIERAEAISDKPSARCPRRARHFCPYLGGYCCSTRYCCTNRPKCCRHRRCGC